MHAPPLLLSLFALDTCPGRTKSDIQLGLNRLHSHEQVMGDELIVSIIQLERLQ